MKKRLLFLVSIIVILALAFSLVACNNDTKVDTNTSTNQQNEEKLPDTNALAPVPSITLNLGEVYSGDTVANIELPVEYSFVDATTAIKNGTNDYAAKYTKDDKTSDAIITLIAVVKTLSPESHVITGVYENGTRLGDIELPAGYDWNDPSESVISGINEYDVVFTDGTLGMAAKATINALMTNEIKAVVDLDPVELSAGAKLSSVVLPEGITWVNAEDELVLGRHSYNAKYVKKYEGNKSVEYIISVPVTFGSSLDIERANLSFIESELKSDAFKEGDNNAYKTTLYDQYVMILARNSEGKQVDKGIRDAYLDRVAKVVIPAVDKTTNVAHVEPENYGANYTINTVMTLLCLGESTIINGVDLLAPFYNSAYMLNDNNDLFFYINALNIINNITIKKNYTTADGQSHVADVAADQVINKLISFIGKDGGFASMWGPGYDYDAMSMGMHSLSYLQRPGDEKYLDPLQSMLIQNIGAKGGVVTWGGDSLFTTATTIQAFSTRGVDSNMIFNSNLNTDTLYEFLITDVQSDGSFKSQGLMKDGAMAIVAYNRYLKGMEGFYDIAN